jgi:hypothetical protein
MWKALSVLLGLSVLSPDSASAEWRVMTTTDVTTGNQTTFASTENSDRYSLGIYRREDGDVWATFALPSSAVPVDTLTDSVGVFRVDNMQAHDLSILSLLDRYSGTAWLGRMPRALAFSIGLDRREKSPTVGQLREIMNGKNLIFTYFLVGGGSKDIEFGLDGSKTAIAMALSIPEDPDPDNVARRAIWAEALRQCLTKSGGKLHCAITLSSCDKSPDFSSKALSVCLRDGAK